MKRILKTAPLVLGLLALVLAACLNPADPAEPDLDLYREVNNSGLHPGHTFDISDFFTIPGAGFNLTPPNLVDYIDVAPDAARFKDNEQAIQAIKDSFEFKALREITVGGPTYKAYTAYPEGDPITVKSVAVTPDGAAIRVTLDLSPAVSSSIQLRIKAESLVGARDEKIDTNGNLVAGEPEDDVYYNRTVTGSSVPLGTGAARNHWAITNATGGFPGGFLNNVGFDFPARPDGAYDVKARVTWNYAESLGRLDTDDYIRGKLDAHVIVEKFTRDDDEAAWTAVQGAWATDPLGVFTFTAAAPAGDFDIYRLNLKDRGNLETQGEYYGFRQKLLPLDNNRNEQVLIQPTIPTPVLAKFIGGAPGAAITPIWTNDKGGWIDLPLPGTVAGVDAATLLKENFRLYAASGTAANTVLAPLRGIPVHSVSQYVDGTDVHLIIRFDPNYKKTGGDNFRNGYGPNANWLQVWIGKEVKVYDNTGTVRYLGSGAAILSNNGIEDFSDIYGYVDANQL
jgi:hypothetical protein